MYRNDQRTVITLDAGGTNFVFGAIRANKFIVVLSRFPLMLTTWISVWLRLLRALSR